MTSSESEDEMQCRLLLYIIVVESTGIVELLASKDQTLLVGRYSLLVLYLALDILDGVRWFNFKGDGLARECLNEDLHGAGLSVISIIVRQALTWQ